VIGAGVDDIGAEVCRQPFDCASPVSSAGLKEDRFRWGKSEMAAAGHAMASARQEVSRGLGWPGALDQARLGHAGEHGGDAGLARGAAAGADGGDHLGWGDRGGGAGQRGADGKDLVEAFLRWPGGGGRRGDLWRDLGQRQFGLGRLSPRAAVSAARSSVGSRASPASASTSCGRASPQGPPARRSAGREYRAAAPPPAL